jgi:hypothetical protein
MPPRPLLKRKSSSNTGSREQRLRLCFALRGGVSLQSRDEIAVDISRHLVQAFNGIEVLEHIQGIAYANHRCQGAGYFLAASQLVLMIRKRAQADCHSCKGKFWYPSARPPLWSEKDPGWRSGFTLYSIQDALGEIRGDWRGRNMSEEVVEA